uniref:Uncharacterized protein n=1 Tax=Rhizophora mucronata TaxID=61149 RepID=A0A2P2NYF7_RHIMU
MGLCPVKTSQGVLDRSMEAMSFFIHSYCSESTAQWCSVEITVK